ncbi:MAG: ABC transporter substrate-binding protein [Chloroflexi bacterium]|nr:ABC transporter substrate-binding protein [Chloroflexota bacterium]MBP7042088.1 ABC transporter substrate-binding protein [Chloroflexota bacterium]
MKRAITIKSLLLIVFLMVNLAACAAESKTQQAIPVAIKLRWTHNAQFGGLYAADQEGYFAAEGVEATFLEGGPGTDPIAAVLDGEAQFGVAGADVILLARSQGKPVRAVATIYQRNPVVFFALAETGITSPQQFAGKTIRATLDMLPTLHAMMTFINVPPDTYQIIELPSDIAQFASGEVPIWGGFVTGMALDLQQAGYEINVIYPDNYGVHFYADTLFTTDAFMAESPDVVTRVVKATSDGLTFAITQPEAIGPMVALYNDQADLSAESLRMMASIPLIQSGTTRIGWMDQTKWQEMHDILLAQGMLPNEVDVSTVFTLEFLEKSIGEGE